MKRFDVTKYGIEPNTDELLTKKVQRLIDSVDKGEIYFPKGKYVLSTLFLKSDITINIDKGAEILGSLDFNDYTDLEPVNFPLYQDISHSYFDCSLFIAKNAKNIIFKGCGKIDMRSVWDEDNKNNNVHRGAKVICLKECENVLIKELTILNATDLAVYFAGSNNVTVKQLKLKVYIDGISPDNSKNVLIKNCQILSGDDGVVFKSSYNLNRIGECRDIVVKNCQIQSRCNAIKFGTESNGLFENITINKIEMSNTRFAGIAIESVDGGHINNIKISNIKMNNINAPIFIHLGNRLRGPKGTEIGSISNIKLENIVAKGPYVSYPAMPMNYIYYKNNDCFQDLWVSGHGENMPQVEREAKETWQYTSNICGLPNHPLENIELKNIQLELFGNVKKYEKNVSEVADGYPEVYVYGRVLPASGLYARHINNLVLNNVNIKTIYPDKREEIVLEDVK